MLHTSNNPDYTHNRLALVGSEIDRIKRMKQDGRGQLYENMSTWMTSKILTDSELDQLSKVIGKPCINCYLVPQLFEVQLTHPDLDTPMEYLSSGNPDELEELNYYISNGYRVSKFLPV